MKKLIHENTSVIAFLGVIISFIFMRLPFYVLFPLPGFRDINQYFAYAQIIDNGYIPIFGVIPPGYCLFLFIAGKITDSNIFICYIQSLIMLLSSLFLLYVVHVFYKKIIIGTAIALSIWLSCNFTLWVETTIGVDSLYTSAILAIVALFILVVNSKKCIYWIAFSLILVVPSIIRSNGVIVYVILPSLILYMVLFRYRIKYYMYLLLPLLSLNIIWSIYNYKTLDVFIPGNPERISATLGFTPPIENYPKRFPGDTADYTNSRKGTLWDCFTIFTHPFHNFYYRTILDRHQFYTDSIHQGWYYNIINHGEVYIKYLHEDSIRVHSDTGSFFKRYIYKENYDPTKVLANSTYLNEVYDYKRTDGVLYDNFLYGYFVLYLIDSHIFRNIIWVVLFLLLFVVDIYLLLNSRFKNKVYFIIATICLLHLTNVLVLWKVNIRSIYFFPTELIYYLPIPFILYIIPRSEQYYGLIKSKLFKNH